MVRYGKVSYLPSRLQQERECLVPEATTKLEYSSSYQVVLPCSYIPVPELSYLTYCLR